MQLSEQEPQEHRSKTIIKDAKLKAVARPHSAHTCVEVRVGDGVSLQGDGNAVVHAGQQHLSMVVDKPALLGRPECARQVLG